MKNIKESTAEHNYRLGDHVFVWCNFHKAYLRAAVAQLAGAPQHPATDITVRVDGLNGPCFCSSNNLKRLVSVDKLANGTGRLL